MSFQILRLVLSKRAANSGAKLLSARSMSSVEQSKSVDDPADPNAHLPFKPCTLDDLPPPQGDWYEDYKKKQKKYWRDLFIGIFSFSATCYYMYAYDTITFWNYYYPELPPKEERLKTFWVAPEEDDDDDD